MKTLKISIITLLLLLPGGLLIAQDYKIAVPNTKDGKVVLKGFSGDLPVEGYAGNEILITSATGRIEPPERAKGLKPIYPSGTDNTGIGVSVEKNGNTVIITCLVPFTRETDYTMKMPENLAIEIEAGCENSSNITITGIKNEITVKNCHDINLKNVTGPLVLSTIAGNIEISFGSITADKPFSINSISGDVDVTLPVKTAVNIELSTISGGFYSDFEIPGTKEYLKRIGGNHINFDLNGGGFKFSIVTVSGNVYLRKGN